MPYRLFLKQIAQNILAGFWNFSVTTGWSGAVSLRVESEVLSSAGYRDIPEVYFPSLSVAVPKWKPSEKKEHST